MHQFCPQHYAWTPSLKSPLPAISPLDRDDTQMTAVSRQPDRRLTRGFMRALELKSGTMAVPDGNLERNIIAMTLSSHRILNGDLVGGQILSDWVWGFLGRCF